MRWWPLLGHQSRIEDNNQFNGFVVHTWSLVMNPISFEHILYNRGQMHSAGLDCDRGPSSRVHSSSSPGIHCTLQHVHDDSSCTPAYSLCSLFCWREIDNLISELKLETFRIYFFLKMITQQQKQFTWLLQQLLRNKRSWEDRERKCAEMHFLHVKWKHFSLKSAEWRHDYLFHPQND